jgi:hypothetical protein
MRHVRQRWLFASLFVGALFAPVATRAQTPTTASWGASAAAEETKAASTEMRPAAEGEAASLPAAAADKKLPDSAAVQVPSDKPAGLDFEFFGPDSAGAPGADSSANSSHISEQAKTRRHRLGVHQFLGLTTWAFMAASCVIGQLNYNDLYAGGSGRGGYMMPHRLLVYSTTGLFTATGIYALLAPQPYKKPLKFDTGLVHRVAAIGATAGMVAQVVLGFITARTADAGNPSGLKQMAMVHDLVGWTTFGFMTAAGAAWLF